MAITYNPNELSADVRAKMSSSLMADTSKRQRSPFTELGKELGIDIFSLKAKGFVDDSFIAYIPKMPAQYNAEGRRVKWSVPVTYHTLRVLGNGNEKENYAGRLINTRDRFGFEAFGISGNPVVIDEYMSKAWEYKKAHDLLVAARDGYSSLDEMPEDDRKSLVRDGFKFMPIAQEVGEFYFPIVIIETEKDEKGKSTMTPKVYPVLDEKGKQVLTQDGKPKVEPRGHMMWYKASEKTMAERIVKALKPLALDKDDDVEGLIFVFDYSIKPDPEGKSKGLYDTPEMKSANSLTISVLPEIGNNKKVYDGLKALGLFDKWDEEANANYNELMLPATVVACQYESDEEIKTRLDNLYGSIDEKIEQLRATRDNILAIAKGGAGATASASIGNSSLESTLGISLGGDADGDDDSDLSFDAVQ